MNELIINAGIAVVTVGILMAYIEWRNQEYTAKTTVKLDAIMRKLIDIKNR